VRLALVILTLALTPVPSCARFSSRQIETAPDGTQRVTRIAVWTFFDAHNDLSKLRASTTDRTQGVSLAGLDQSASSTNTLEILRHISAIIGAAK
jgi:hypothetical protein